MGVPLTSIDVGCVTLSDRDVFVADYGEMARGQQKLQSQAKAAEKMNKMKKQQGHSATDQKKAAQKALVHVCAVCKVCATVHN